MLNFSNNDQGSGEIFRNARNTDLMLRICTELHPLTLYTLFAYKENAILVLCCPLGHLKRIYLLHGPDDRTRSFKT